MPSRGAPEEPANSQPGWLSRARDRVGGVWNAVREAARGPAGTPIAALRAVAADAFERRKPSVVPNNQLPVTSFADWDRAWQIRGVLTGFERGADLAPAAILADGMMRDDRITGIMGTRVGSLKATPLEFKGASSRRKAQKIAEELGGSDEAPGLWSSIAPPSVIGDLSYWGNMLGVGVAEIIWTIGPDGRSWLPTLRTWHPQFLRYDWPTGRFYLRTAENPMLPLPQVDREPRSDGRWVIWCPHSYHHGWRHALIRPLAMLYLSRQWTYRDWSRYNEKHGQPADKVYVPEGAPPEEKADFAARIANRGADTTLILPRGENEAMGYDVQVLEATARSWDSFEKHIAKLETDMAICVLGQNLTTEVQGGSLAASQVHEAVRLDKRREDAALAECLRNQVLTHWAEFNYGDPELAPRVRFLVDPPEDELAEAQTMSGVGDAISALQIAGIDVDAEAIADRFGIPVHPPAEAGDDAGAQTGAQPHADAGVGANLTPSAEGAITKVNEARAAKGMPPLTTAGGALDPDGELTIAEFLAKRAALVSQAAAAEAGKSGPTDPSLPPALPGMPPPRAGQGAPVGDAGEEDGKQAPTAKLRALTTRTVLGRKRALAYAERVAQNGRRAAAAAMSVDLAELKSLLENASSYEDLRRQVLAKYKRGTQSKAVARILERTLLMGKLAGRQGGIEDI